MYWGDGVGLKQKHEKNKVDAFFSEDGLATQI